MYVCMFPIVCATLPVRKMRQPNVPVHAAAALHRKSKIATEASIATLASADLAEEAKV